ncbi:MAG TPA: methylated-DNA--[protein]-cysteine S-methyltransferase [Flavobacteriales bacterium]|nr:methylated-DNA--[protein]-cysteine S-methyltransferase [Flavobacteriales bacterium]HRO39781.1 methylated-DNA--[protein]-cysteine S-methyltransferase [Flavobacteriales bacterium]HRP81263.1 methylated-DNA--[protein]-cysteine S-methyltransferase [Flavobacteriales bacterium]HRQ84856.1 methylated-DNA--[protein]-cysteine S-methyltransferase [Flavobacteriales bacterium]
MEPILIHPFHTPFGELLLGSFNNELCLCDWRYRRMRTAIDARIQRGLQAEYVESISPVIEQAKAQLNAYFAGERTTFDLPVRLVGTEFQLRVWQALRAVPYGTTLSYAALTAKVAEPTAIRAVASTNGANALSIMVPCHRIIGSDGELTGYAGGLGVKRRLLQLEKATMGTPQVDLFSMPHSGIVHGA